MNNDEAYKRIENIVFKYEEKELPSLEDRKLNNEALNHIREALKNEQPQSEWIRIDEEKVKCPICEVIHLMYSYPRTTANFCPACGAKLCMGEQK